MADKKGKKTSKRLRQDWKRDLDKSFNRMVKDEVLLDYLRNGPDDPRLREEHIIKLFKKRIEKIVDKVMK